MACNCFKTTERLLRKQIMQGLQDEIAEIVKTGFEHRIRHSGGGDSAPVALNYQFRYYRRCRNGYQEILHTEADRRVTMDYCPLCGTKYEGKRVT